MEIHTTGYAWKYIRASMTLTGFLPPMTDEEGNMLVDGGYMDNLTVCSPVFSKLTFRSLR
jgi:lysophospholipid hydrolase